MALNQLPLYPWICNWAQHLYTILCMFYDCWHRCSYLRNFILNCHTFWFSSRKLVSYVTSRNKIHSSFLEGGGGDTHVQVLRACVCVYLQISEYSTYTYHTNSSTEVLLVLFNYKTHNYVKKVCFSAITVIFVFTLTPAQLTMNTWPNSSVVVAILLLNILYLLLCSH